MNSDWKIYTLGDVCEFYNGKAHEKIIDKNGKYIVVNSKFISTNGKVIKKTNYIISPLIKGDIVLVMSDVPNGKALAKCFLIDKNNTYSLNQRICAIRSSKFYNKFLFYQLNRNRYFLEFDNGENQTNLRKNEILNCPLFLPPLSEQKRIVKILDKAFAAIDKAIANTQKNLQNSKELFNSYLNNIFSNPGKAWEEKKLGEIYDVRDGTHDSPKYHSEGHALITSKNLKKEGLNFNKVKYISKTDYLNINKRSAVKKGDVLFAMIGTIGNPIVVEVEPKFAIKNVALFKVPPEKDSYFLKYYLESYVTIKRMISEAKGTTQKFVSLGYLRNFQILIPNIKEQKSIVKKLDTLSSKTKRLESVYQQKLKNLEELKKSILQKAFNGEL